MKNSSANLSKKENTPFSDSRENKKAKKNIINDIFEFVELVAIAFAIILIISAFFFRHSVVSGGSMQKTLNDGEHLIISDFLYEPKFSEFQGLWQNGKLTHKREGDKLVRI